MPSYIVVIKTFSLGSKDYNPGKYEDQRRDWKMMEIKFSSGEYGYQGRPYAMTDIKVKASGFLVHPYGMLSTMSPYFPDRTATLDASIDLHIVTADRIFGISKVRDKATSSQNPSGGILGIKLNHDLIEEPYSVKADRDGTS
ncbi:hypothetical protein J6590_074938 [Homalodisca vitripennis]|nr:hypothetical protein J6590_074938 [Homalodisca vitripennis]